MKEIKDLKLKDIKKINELDEKSIREEITNSSRNLYVLKMKKSLGELKQTHLIKALKRYIAKVKTVANIKGYKIG